jgi:hypothetical protein
MCSRSSLVKYIPEWMLPGGGFKKQAREWKKLTDAMVEVPFQMVKKQVVSLTRICVFNLAHLLCCLKADGDSVPSFVSKCLDSDSGPKRAELSDKLIKETAAVAYAAGMF